MNLEARNSARWYRSFYWRIGISFVVLVIAVIVAQSAIMMYFAARSRMSLSGRSPNTLAAIAAADISSALTQNPSVDLKDYLTREYAGFPLPVYVVLKDGRTMATTSSPLNESVRHSVEAILAGTDPRQVTDNSAASSPPVVTAPLQVAGELRGIVVMPPNIPERSPLLRDVSRVLSVPGTVLLITATTIAALFIFAPARQRLRALERATQRLGTGDLTARAPEQGGDEISRVAGAFNRMAAELSARDDALRTSDRLRRQMLADVSHELKTPLTTMRGYLETLRMPGVDLDPQTRLRYLETVERETLRLNRIVKDLLDLAQLESGGGRFVMQLFAIGRVFGHVIQRHEQEARRRSIALRHVVANEADQVFADPHRLEQVVENLVANALRHTPDGGTVELAARINQAHVEISTTDSGEGIPSEHIPHVFERFYKVDSGRSSGSSGSGLGLSIAKAIVERHNGAIRVKSTPGRTAFTIVLPAS